MAVAGKTALPAKQANVLKRMAGKYNARTAEVDQIRVELDKVVRDSRDAGGTFREIASLAERSVAWVQGSLQRSQRRDY